MGGQIDKVTEDLRSKKVTGSAGGGMVQVHINGLSEVLQVEVDEILRERGDIEMITDLLPAAFNDAVAKSKALHVEAMRAITGGVELPGGLDEKLRQILGGGSSGERTSDDSNKA